MGLGAHVHGLMILDRNEKVKFKEGVRLKLSVFFLNDKVLLNQSFINIKKHFTILNTVSSEPSQRQILIYVCTNFCILQIILYWD